MLVVLGAWRQLSSKGSWSLTAGLDSQATSCRTTEVCVPYRDIPLLFYYPTERKNRRIVYGMTRCRKMSCMPCFMSAVFERSAGRLYVLACTWVRRTYRMDCQVTRQQRHVNRCCSPSTYCDRGRERRSGCIHAAYERLTCPSRSNWPWLLDPEARLAVASLHFLIDVVETLHIMRVSGAATLCRLCLLQVERQYCRTTSYRPAEMNRSNAREIQLVDIVRRGLSWGPGFGDQKSWKMWRLLRAVISSNDGCAIQPHDGCWAKHSGFSSFMMTVNGR
jgi:hypothetical protein